MINPGVSTVITGLLFWYIQNFKKGKHSFNCLPRCQRKAILKVKQGDRNRDKPTSQMEPVSYSKITDEAATLQGRVQSAPPEEAATSSKFVNSGTIIYWLYYVVGIICPEQILLW